MTEDVLEGERAHLAASRVALRAMREETARHFAAAVGGNALSTEVLKQVLYRRMVALEDDPDVPLFFGRLDYAVRLGAEADEVLYIGRRHVAGELGGDPLVMDWRAPMAVPFYRASPTEPMGVAARRRFGLGHGRLTAFEDELLEGSDQAHDSAMLRAEIERPRTGPMRDIVATIQPDQDVLVRSELAQSLCIQGAPGTGKTAVGLHRAAFLLYAYRDQLSRSGIAVIGPNDAFLSYIADVLPALGEIDATSETIESLLSGATGVAARGTEPAAVAVLKGDVRMADVLTHAVWGSLLEPTEALVVPRGSRQIRLSPDRVAGAVRAVRSLGVRYEAGRALLASRLAHEVLLVLEAQGDTTDDRVQAAVARHPATKRAVAGVWPKLSATSVLHRLLSDPETLARHADGILSPDEQALLLWAKPPKTPRSAPWTSADLALLDELGDLLSRTPSLGHVVVDEAQDLSPMMLRAVGRRASTGSLTVLGDLAQATTPWGTPDWGSALAHLGQPDARVTELVQGFRVPGEVLDYAARLLPAIAPTLKPPVSLRHSKDALAFEPVPDVLAALPGVVARVVDREGSVGVIVPDARIQQVGRTLADAGLAVGDLTAGFGERVELVAASLAKGLEFDHVVMVEPADIVSGEPDERTGQRRLYVCLTRAVSTLTIVHAQPIPAALSGDRPELVVAAVVLRDAAGRVLSVRKRGTQRFMLPGGKLEAGESSADAAVREVREELGLELDPAGLRFLGPFVTDAANEPGHGLRADVYAYERAVAGESAAAEIAEVRWLAVDEPDELDAPLTHAVLAGI